MANKRFIRIKFSLLITILANNILIVANLASYRHIEDIKDVCGHLSIDQHACQHVTLILFWTITAIVLILNNLAYTGVHSEDYHLILYTTIMLSLSFLILSFRLYSQCTFYNVFKSVFILLEACLAGSMIKLVMVNNERRNHYLLL